MWPFSCHPRPNTEIEGLEYFAAKGDAESQFKLGMMYDGGKRVPRDEAKGLALIQKAAEQGAAIASSTLSSIYMGRGDFPKGFQWLQKAAEQGLANAQGQLGILYASGVVVPKDEVQAYAWLTVASANDCPGDNQMRDQLLKTLSPAQRSQVLNLSVKLLARLPKIPFRVHAETVGML